MTVTIWHIFAVAMSTLGVGCTVLIIVTMMINKRIDDTNKRIDDTNSQLAEMRKDLKEILARMGQTDQTRRAN